MDFNESEKEDSLVDDNGSEYEDEDDELCDVKSNKSREDNEMNEVFHVAQSTNSQLQLWRIASLLILIGTFVAILTSTILIINGEHDDDDEEAVSDVLDCYCLAHSSSNMLSCCLECGSSP